MDLGLKNRLALVFGATRGLGRSVAEQLVNEGCEVIITGRNEASVTTARNELQGQAAGQVHGVVCDVTKEADVRGVFAQLRQTVGSPEVVVYNNGGPPDAAWSQATDQDFLQGFTTQVLAFKWVLEESTPSMREKGWGRIVTMGSRAARAPHRTLPMVVHNTLRPAALGLSKTAAVELAPYGITINTIGTGLIDGGEENSFRRTYREQAETVGVPYEELIAARFATIPLGRGGHPGEVGALCAYLCSEQAAFITGQLILVDGGEVNSLY